MKLSHKDNTGDWTIDTRVYRNETLKITAPRNKRLGGSARDGYRRVV